MNSTFPGTTTSHVNHFKSMARVKSESESQVVQISLSRVAATRVNKSVYYLMSTYPSQASCSNFQEARL